MSGGVIAIVGMACRYPDARSPHELWQNVLAQRRAFRRLPRERLDLADYAPRGPGDPDAIAAGQAAVIEGWTFDRERFRIAGPTYRQVDPAHWLALEVAADALADAGFSGAQGLPREATGVIVGNTLTGEFSRAAALRLRWPYVRRVAAAALRDHGVAPAPAAALLADLERRFKEPFTPPGEETLAGGLSNTIAGRVCNHFDLKGGGYTIDGACAASLLAVAHACERLVLGDLDVALAGGVDLSLDPFELVGFSRAGALAADRMRVYDQRSAGFWPGEGCGFVVLMREADAAARRLRVYARVRGWGVASDGSGGITRPEAEGQLLAIARAYRRAGFDIGTVGYLEGHGTGTAVGDATELEVLSRARRQADPGAPPAALGSIKANLGHTKAAAGIAGLIKAALVVHHRVVPPTTGCERPHAVLAAGGPLAVTRQAAPWPADRPVRAAVSAMGFGGIDTHVVLEGGSAAGRGALGAEEAELSATPQDAELFLIGAADPAELGRTVAALAAIAGRLSLAELTDAAAALVPPAAAAARAAVVASTPEELAQRLARLREWLEAGAERRLDPGEGTFLGGSGEARIGLLFPGQGSPSHLGGGEWPRRFPFARERWPAWAPGGDPQSTRIAQPAIVSASLAALDVLSAAGVEAVVALGHSLGELTALHWAGAFDDAALVRIAAARGIAMAEAGGVPGAMASLAAGPAAAAALVEGTGVVLAGFNAPERTVVSGEAGAVAGVIERARARGIAGTRLPVSHAFHSPLVAPAAEALRRHLAGEAVAGARRPVVSTIAGRALRPDDDPRALLLAQVVSPVRFVEALSAARGVVDLWIEAGPGAVLSGLAAGQDAVPAIAVDAGGESFAGLLEALGAAWALGAPVRHAALFDGRFTRPFDLAWRPRFLANPCESAPREEPAPPVDGDGVGVAAASPGRGARDGALGGSAEPHGSRVAAAVSAAAGDATFGGFAGSDGVGLAAASPGSGAAAAPAAGDGSADGAPASALELVRGLVAARAELPPAAVADDHGLLRDLHLNSIVVGQVAAEAARRLGLASLADPTAWAGATVAELARALEEIRAAGPAAAEPDPGPPPGIDVWVRGFEVREVERPRAERPRPFGPGRWSVLALPGDPLAPAVERALAAAGGGRGVVACLPADADERCAGLLIDARDALWPERDGAAFVVVERDGGGGGAFARTLQLESPETAACVVGVPDGDPRAAGWVAEEALSASGFAEARYGRDGVRRVPRLTTLEPGGEPTTLSPADVLLVTGGGKGIAAECALELARGSGARLAIVGRSDPGGDATLAANLARLTAAGVAWRYRAADVADAGATRAAVAALAAELGPITAFLHGAGANQPRPLAALDEAAFQRTLAPKLAGARHVLAALDPARLRLLVAFGSIIARTGMPGEADYAVANEWLTRLLERHQARHPGCRCLSVEWSVWSGTGMGERLGRIDRLARAGIAAITPEVGVRMLRGLLERRTPVAVVVTGRHGRPPALAAGARELPLWRFLERVHVDVPGVELVADAELGPDADPYLEDHAWNGARLFPAALGLEAMAQAARAVLGTDAAPVFEALRFERPIVMDAAGRRRLRIAALARGPGSVEVALRCDDTGFQTDHFRGIVRFEISGGDNGRLPAAASGRGSPAGAASAGGRWSPPAAGGGNGVASATAAVASGDGAAAGGRPAADGPRSDAGPDPVDAGLDPARDLYGAVLFQSGRFRRVGGYRRLRARESAAELTPAGDSPWFGPWMPAALVLGDPGARDAALHSIQASIPHRTLLPVAVERLEAGILPAAEPLAARARERRRDGDTLVYDLEIADARGAVIERWQGLELRAAGSTGYRGPWPPALLGAFLERRFLECAPDIAAVLRENGGTDATLRRALGREAAIARRPDGRPEVAGEPGVHVSAARAGALTLALAGAAPVGCDLERVAAREPAAWRELLGAERAALADAVARAAGEDADAACTRVWTAVECLKKSGAPPGAPLRLAGPAESGWLVLESGAARVASYVAALASGERVAIGLTSGTPDARV